MHICFHTPLDSENVFVIWDTVIIQAYIREVRLSQQMLFLLIKKPQIRIIADQSLKALQRAY